MLPVGPSPEPRPNLASTSSSRGDSGDSGLASSASLSTGSSRDEARDDSADSSSFSGCSSDSEDVDDSPQAVVLQDATAVAGQGDGAPQGVSVQGNLSVEKCSSVLFGTKTIYNGPVTVVVADNKTVSGVPVHALTSRSTPADGDLLLSAAALEHSCGSPPTWPRKGSSTVEPFRKQDWRRVLRWPYVAAIVAALAAVVAVIIIGVLVSAAGNEHTTEPTTTEGITSGTPAYPAPAGLELVTRSEWGARPQRSTSPLTTPVEVVIVEHTVTASCYDKLCGIRRVACIQSFHMDKGWDDIGYSFLVASDGLVYEGRGWDAVGAFAQGWNWKAVGVAAIGTFIDVPPSTAQISAIERLLQWGVDLRKIHPGYRLYGKCQVRDSLSPGRAFMSVLKTWSHWQNNSDTMPDYCK